MARSDDPHDAILKANANVEHMSSLLADFVRAIMRSTATNGRSSQAYNAMEALTEFLRHLPHAEDVRTYDLIEKTIDDLTVEVDENSLDCDRVRAAKMGMRYLIEASCRDGAARGRSAKRMDEFEHAWKMVDELRDYRIKRSMRGDG
jgi:hypothetical protein